MHDKISRKNNQIVHEFQTSRKKKWHVNKGIKTLIYPKKKYDKGRKKT